MQFKAEIVRDFDGSYYANVCIDANNIEGIKEYVSYKELRKEIFEKTHFDIGNLDDLEFKKYGRKHYAYVERSN